MESPQERKLRQSRIVRKQAERRRQKTDRFALLVEDWFAPHGAMNPWRVIKPLAYYPALQNAIKYHRPIVPAGCEECRDEGRRTMIGMVVMLAAMHTGTPREKEEGVCVILIGRCPRQHQQWTMVVGDKFDWGQGHRSVISLAWLMRNRYLVTPQLASWLTLDHAHRVDVVQNSNWPPVLGPDHPLQDGRINLPCAICRLKMERRVWTAPPDQFPSIGDCQVCVIEAAPLEFRWSNQAPLTKGLFGRCARHGAMFIRTPIAPAPFRAV